MRLIRHVGAAFLFLLGQDACDPGTVGSTDAHIQRAALTELFLVRERAPKAGEHSTRSFHEHRDGSKYHPLRTPPIVAARPLVTAPALSARSDEC